MIALAIVCLVLWVVGSLVFFEWTHKYPEYQVRKPFAVKFTSACVEIAFLALAFWVLVRS